MVAIKEPGLRVGKELRDRLAGLPERQQPVAVGEPVQAHLVGDEVGDVRALAVAVAAVAECG